MARPRLSFLVCFLSFVSAGLTELAAWQVIIQGNAVPAEEEKKRDPNQTHNFVTERFASRRITLAKELLDKGDIDQGLEKLQQTLDDDADYFHEPAGNARAAFHGLKIEAMTLLGKLPPKVRQVYVAKYGETARQMLQAGLESRDLKQLEEVARRFFHTPAGYEATYLLAMNYLDHDEPLAAALRLEQLRQLPADVTKQWEPLLTLKTAVGWGRAGDRQKCIDLLWEMKQRHNLRHLEVAGERVELFQKKEDAIPWLVKTLGHRREFASLDREEWAMRRGNPQRTAQGTFSCVLGSPAWQYDSLAMECLASGALPGSLPEKSPSVEQKIKEHQARVRSDLQQLVKEMGGDDQFLSLPAAHPLLVNDAVLIRSLTGTVKALDARTGKVRWETFFDENSDYGWLMKPENNVLVRNYMNANSTPLQNYLLQRAWNDATAGTLSADDQHFYLLADLDFLGNQRNLNARIASGQTNLPDWNTLQAYDVTNGLFKWEIGGPDLGKEDGLSGTFFLGVPLTLGNRLYVLGENGGEIRLMCIDPSETPRPTRPEWSQALVVPEASVDDSPQRRVSGLTPSYADGVMICPTGAGCIVAVDLARRMLLWGYQYSSPRSNADPRFNALQMRMMGLSGFAMLESDNGWIDPSPIIAEGRALLTPRDSEELHCLSLAEQGELLWKIPRGEGVYLACVHDGKAVIVGRGTVMAYRLADGQPAWLEPTEIPLPGGSGYQSGDRYHLPLSTGEVATLDLRNGMLLACRTLPGGERPGNLLSVNGLLISQTETEIVGYPPLETQERELARKLQAAPKDPQLLALQGELELRRGNDAQALALLRQSYAEKPDDVVRGMIFDRLLEGLRLDFPNARADYEELGKWASTPEEQTQLARSYARGLLQAGETEAAFAQYLKLAELAPAEPTLERLPGNRLVSSDQWIRTRFEELRAVASPEVKAKMEAMAEELIRQAMEDRDAAQLRHQIACFPELPVAQQAREALAGLLKADEDALELECLLIRLRASREERQAAFATARLAAFYVTSAYPEDAVPLLAELSERFRDQVCLDGKTGAELVAGWKADQAIAEHLEPPRPWPNRRLEANSRKPTGGFSSLQANWPVEFVSPRSPHFEGWSLQLDQRRQIVIAFDAHGVQRWELSLPAIGVSSPNVYSNSAMTYQRLIVLTLGREFVMLDTLSNPNDVEVVWKGELTEDSDNPLARNLNFRPLPGPNGAMRMQVTDQLGRPLGAVGVVNDRYLAYQVGERIRVVDPFTGRLLWELRNVARGSQMCGDETRLFVQTPGSDTVTGYAASDGRQLGSQVIPNLGSDKALYFRTHLVYASRLHNPARLSLTAWSLDERKKLWERDFDAESTVADVEADQFAVLEPSGQFTILELPSGRELVRERLLPREKIQRIVVCRSAEHFTLLTHEQPPFNNAQIFLNQGYSQTEINGPAYGFDRKTGKKLWTAYIDQQAVDLGQPGNLPVLIFSARFYTPPLPGLNRTTTQFAVTILDKRNGKILFDQRDGNTVARFETKVNRQKEQIDVNIGKAVVELTFSDNPLDAPADWKPPAEAKPENAEPAPQPLEEK